MAVTKSTRIVRSFLCVFHLQRKNYWLIKTDFALKGNEYRLLTGLFLDPGMVTYFHYPSIRLLLSVMPRLHEENLSLPFLTKLGEPFTRETKSWLEYRRLTSQAVGSLFSIVGSHFQPSQLSPYKHFGLWLAQPAGSTCMVEARQSEHAWALLSALGKAGSTFFSYRRLLYI